MIHTLTVEDGMRLVIYRNGRFSRLLGPGHVTIFDPPDKIERIEDFRNQPVEVPVDGVFPQSLPLTVFINLWLRYDPETITAGDKKRLRELVMIQPRHRHDQMRNDLREALIRSTRRVNQIHGVSSDASPIDQVAPVFPDSPWNEELMQWVAAEVAPRLLLLGLILDPSRPIQVTRLEPSDEDRQSFIRDRRAGTLRQRFPNLSDLALAQLVAAFEGQSPVRIQEIRVEGSADTHLETSVPGPNGEITRVGISPRAATPATSAASVQPERERLTKSDLKVLKPIPRPDKSHRAA